MSEVDQACDLLIIDWLMEKVELQWNLNLSLTKITQEKQIVGFKTEM